MRASPEASGWRPPGSDGLVRAGFGVFGCLAVSDYDALVPDPWRSEALLSGARSVVIVANGGPDLFARFESSPEARQEADPLDAYTRRVIEAEAAHLGRPARAVFPFERRGGAYADFVALARAAGLGAPSRLGMLLHPVYGPWFALRAAILIPELADLPEAAEAPGGFDPCAGCPAPCTRICPAKAPGPTGFDRAACLATRAVEPGCRLRCDARRACVVGPEHRYPEAVEAHHMRHAPLPESPPDGAC